MKKSLFDFFNKKVLGSSKQPKDKDKSDSRGNAAGESTDISNSVGNDEFFAQATAAAG